MKKSKDEPNDEKNEVCTSIFKNGILTREAYTNIWTELITASERRKSVNFTSSR